MTQKPKTCEGCVLHSTGKGFVLDEVVPNPEYAIVGDAPSKAEVEQGKLLVGSAGFVTKAWIMKAVPTIQVAYEKKRVSVCNILKCLPPEQQGKAYPTGETRAKAEEHCSQYLNMGSPRVVLLCGEAAQRRFFGDELAREDVIDRASGRDVKGVFGRVGRVYEKDGVRYVFAPNPAAILKQPALVGFSQEAFKIAAGVEKVVEPEMRHWREAMAELL